MDWLSITLLAGLALVAITAAVLLIRRASSDRRIRSLSSSTSDAPGYSHAVAPGHVDAEAAGYAAQSNRAGNVSYLA